MPNLPFDCIARILDWVDNRNDLFSLLTVNRDVFDLAASRLYRDPFHDWPHHLSVKFDCLLRLLLSCSPCDGEGADSLQQRPDSGIKRHPPTVDYLSLVRVVCWEGRIHSNTIINTLAKLYKGNQAMLTWALVGHRLHQIEELEMDWEHLDRYLNSVPKMTNLRRIWLKSNKGTNWDIFYHRASELVLAFQNCHGQRSLREFRLLPNPLEGPHDEVGTLDVSGAQRVYSLIPPLKSYPEVPCRGGSTTVLDKLFDSELACYSLVRVSDPHYSFCAWKKLYPGMSNAQLLQRMRGMKMLRFASLTGSDEDILAWAAYEADQRFKPGGTLKAPLVALETLCIYFSSQFNLQPLEDGLRGFHRTLKRLEIQVPAPLEPEEIHLVPVSSPVPLPLLKDLILIAANLQIDSKLWHQAPNIECLLVGPSEVPAPASLAEDQLSVSLAEQRLPGITFACARLRNLTLQHRAVHLFDPDCLLGTPNLETLTLWSRATDPHPRDQDRQRRAENALDIAVRYRSHWTWDWPLSRLTTLYITADLWALGFCFGLLRFCPKLHSMDLFHRGQKPFPLQVKGHLDMTTSETRPSNLNYFHLHYAWTYKLEEVAYLLETLPRVLHLILSSTVRDGYVDFGAKELVALTKARPRLEFVRSDLPLSSNLDDLGLRVKGPSYGPAKRQEENTEYIFGGSARKYTRWD